MKQSRIVISLMLLISTAHVFAAGTTETTVASFPKGDTLTIVVPVSAGGQMDLQSRIVAKYLSQEIGKNVVISNIPGGGTVIGSKTYLADSKDSDSIINLSADHMVFSPIVQKADYSQDNFVPLIALSNTEPLFWVKSDSVFKDWDDVIQEGKKRNILFGTGAPGSAGWISTKLAADSSGIKMDYVVGNSIPENIANLLGNHVEMVLADYPTGREYYLAGKIRPIASAGTQNFTGEKTEINIPTLLSKNINFTFASCNILAMRADAAPEHIAFMQKALDRVYSNKEFQADWQKANQPLMEDSSSAFAAIIIKSKASFVPRIKELLAGN